MADATSLDVSDAQALVGEADGLLKLVSRAVMQQVHDLLPASSSFEGASLEQHGLFQIRCEVAFQRYLTLTVSAKSRAEPFGATASDRAYGFSGGEVGDTPRAAVLALARSRPLFAPWRGEAAPKVDPKAAGDAL